VWWGGVLGLAGAQDQREPAFEGVGCFACGDEVWRGGVRVEGGVEIGVGVVGLLGLLDEARV
jgi:hypothetical protein